MYARLLTLKSWLILAAVVVAAVLLLSWCADQARIKKMRAEATVGQATGKALDRVATETPAIRQEQQEKQREVEKLNGAGLRLPDNFGRDLERVRRQRGESDDPR
jgi:outer membrane murein-binding lipoprotein Lpp